MPYKYGANTAKPTGKKVFDWANFICFPHFNNLLMPQVSVSKRKKYVIKKGDDLMNCR